MHGYDEKFKLGLIVIAALLLFTPYFSLIPKAILAAIIIAAVIFMVEVHVVVPIWNTKKSDLIPGIGTFVACLVLQLEIGILVGIGINVLFILYHAARPKITIENSTTQEGVEYLTLTPDRCLIFPSVDYVRNLVTKHSMKQAIPVVIDCSHIYGADYTAAKLALAVIHTGDLEALYAAECAAAALGPLNAPNVKVVQFYVVVECLTQDFSSRRQPLFFFNLKPSVIAVFNGLQPKGFVVYHSENELDNLIRMHKKQMTEDNISQDIVFTTG